MVDTVAFTPPVTGPDAPAAQADNAAPANLEKALADTKAELTRAQQELAALKKPADAPATQTDPKPADAPAETPTGAEGQPDNTDTKAAAEAVAAAGFDIAPFDEEYKTTGDVTAENREKIAEGLKSVLGDNALDIVNRFIEGDKARISNQRSELYAAGGGEDGYKEMLGWAKGALTAKEAQQFDAAVTSGDHNAALFAIKGLRSRYENVNGKEPSLLGGSGTPSGPPAFASTFEMTAAMRDPRYGKDPVYTKEVEQRTMRSNF